MQVVVTRFHTDLDPQSRHVIDEGTNDVYKSFDDLYLAEKQGALREHAQQDANADAYVEVVTSGDNRAGLYLGIANGGELTIEQAREGMRRAISDFLVENVVFSRGR